MEHLQSNVCTRFAVALLMILMPTTNAQSAKSLALNHIDALRYVAAWASFDHDDVTDLTRNPNEFYGHLGSLDFLYSDSDHTLHAFSFVGAGMDLLLTSRAEIKSTLDRTAKEHPNETANGSFDIRTLPWNRQVTPKLEPCLYLKMDIGDATVPVADMVKRLNDLSTAGFTWHGQKLLHVFADYWKAHPELAKRPVGQR